ncbi:unnamed protein product [Blepharisma stoltei]|uniref:Uncharacterized protein n=1 Tax=Blepharisma stoltei TaxID=1481888 RepID=A0AAU9ISE3_9CILI|nr:unnamed protein product [Blepharisma stoltei]
MAQEIESALNKALENVTTICSSTAEKVEISQNELHKTLSALEEKLQGIKELSAIIDESKITAACESIEKYKARLERIKKRTDGIKIRISKIEEKISAKKL